MVVFGSDLCFSADVFFYLFQREISELRRLIGMKFCTMISNRLYFIMSVQNFGGLPQKKFWGAKHMQNLAWFQMPSNFGSEYFRNRWRYLRSDKYISYHYSSHVVERKFGELWSTNHRDLVVKLYPPKSTFLEDHNWAPKGCCTFKFLHALENDQVLLVHTPPAMGSSLQFFFKGESEIGLKISKCVRITLVVVEVAPWNFSTWRARMPLGEGDNMGTTFGGTADLKIWEGKKFPKIWCNLGQLLTLAADIFGTHREIDKRKTALSTTVIEIKKLVNFVPLTKKL